MSIEAAKEFHLKVQQDETLSQKLLDEAYATNAAPDWAAHAKTCGLHFTSDEADQYLQSLQDSEYELTEIELELVAAGTFVQSDTAGMGGG